MRVGHIYSGAVDLARVMQIALSGRRGIRPFWMKEWYNSHVIIQTCLGIQPFTATAGRHSPKHRGQDLSSLSQAGSKTRWVARCQMPEPRLKKVSHLVLYNLDGYVDVHQYSRPLVWVTHIGHA